MPGSQTGHIFISYSRRDDMVMRRVIEHLRGQGIKVWVDNERLVPGTPIWEHEIEKAIKGASGIVVILSPDAKKSEWVLREITLADQFHKRVFPILVEGTDNDSIPLRLITRQFIDLRKDEATGLGSLSTAISVFLDELTRLEEGRKAAARETASLKQELEARWTVQDDKKTEDETERLDKKRAEDEPISKAELEKIRLAKEERVAKQNAKEGRITQKTIAGEQPSEEKTAPATLLTRFASIINNQRKRISGRHVIGLVSILTIFGIGFGLLTTLGSGDSQTPPAVSLTIAPSDESIEVSPTAPSAPNLDEQIIQRGNIRVGVREVSAWPFDIVDGSSHTGFDIDLAEEIVRRLFDEQIPVVWVPLTSAERHTALQSGEIDMLVRGYVHMTSREDFGLWTSNYFLDGPRFLVRRDSGIGLLEDLDGGRIAITSGSPYEVILQDVASVAGINYETLVFEESSAVYGGLLEGRADAMIGNWTYLLSLSQNNPDIHVVGKLLSNEPFGIVIPPNNPEFRDDVNTVLLSIISDGTWQEIYDRWFTDPPPWTLDEMLAEPPVNR